LYRSAPEAVDGDQRKQGDQGILILYTYTSQGKRHAQAVFDGYLQALPPDADKPVDGNISGEGHCGNATGAFSVWVMARASGPMIFSFQ
jgi:hypothetical protein